MKQIDMFDKLNWPNDFDGAHSIKPIGFGTSHPGYGAVPPKIYESPDKGKTVYERDFGSEPSTRRIIKTSIQQQWNITFKGEEVKIPQNLINFL